MIQPAARTIGLALAMAVTLAGCAMFESDQPMFAAETGAPIYGAAPVLVSWRPLDPDEKPRRIKVDATFANGVYAMQARDEDDTVWRESLHAVDGGTEFYVQQVEMAQEGEPAERVYYYDLLRVRPDGVWAYQLRCGDLSREERDAFGFTPPPPAANPDGSPGAESSTCVVRSPDRLRDAFQLLASRQEPRAHATVKPKKRGWFSRP